MWGEKEIIQAKACHIWETLSRPIGPCLSLAPQPYAALAGFNRVLNSQVSKFTWPWPEAVLKMCLKVSVLWIPTDRSYHLHGELKDTSSQECWSVTMMASMYGGITKGCQLQSLSRFFFIMKVGITVICVLTLYNRSQKARHTHWKMK